MMPISLPFCSLTSRSASAKSLSFEMTTAQSYTFFQMCALSLKKSRGRRSDPAPSVETRWVVVHKLYLVTDKRATEMSRKISKRPGMSLKAPVSNK
jgi:hypothetical protein